MKNAQCIYPSNTKNKGDASSTLIGNDLPAPIA